MPLENVTLKDFRIIFFGLIFVMIMLPLSESLIEKATKLGINFLKKKKLAIWAVLAIQLFSGGFTLLLFYSIILACVWFKLFPLWLNPFYLVVLIGLAVVFYRGYFRPIFNDAKNKIKELESEVWYGRTNNRFGNNSDCNRFLVFIIFWNKNLL